MVEGKNRLPNLIVPYHVDELERAAALKSYMEKFHTMHREHNHLTCSTCSIMVTYNNGVKEWVRNTDLLRRGYWRHPVIIGRLQDIDDELSWEGVAAAINRELAEGIVADNGVIFEPSHRSTPKPRFEQDGGPWGTDLIPLALERRLQKPQDFLLKGTSFNNGLDIVINKNDEFAQIKLPLLDSPDRFKYYGLKEIEFLDGLMILKCSCASCRIREQEESRGFAMCPPIFKEREENIRSFGQTLLDESPLEYPDVLPDFLGTSLNICASSIKRHLNTTARDSWGIIKGLVKMLGEVFVKSSGLNRYHDTVGEAAIKAFTHHIFEKVGLLGMDEDGLDESVYPVNTYYLPYMISRDDYHAIVIRLLRVKRVWDKLLPVTMVSCSKVVMKANDVALHGKLEGFPTVEEIVKEIMDTSGQVIAAYWKYFDSQMINLCNFLLGNYGMSKLTARAKWFGDDLYNDYNDPVASKREPFKVSINQYYLKDSILTEDHASLLMRLFSSGRDDQDLQAVAYRMVHQMLLHHNVLRYEEKFQKVKYDSRARKSEHGRQAKFTETANDVDVMNERAYEKDKSADLFSVLTKSGITRGFSSGVIPPSTTGPYRDFLLSKTIEMILIDHGEGLEDPEGNDGPVRSGVWTERQINGWPDEFGQGNLPALMNGFQDKNAHWTFIYYGRSGSTFEDLLKEISKTKNLVAENDSKMWLLEVCCVLTDELFNFKEAFRVYSNPYIREIMRDNPVGCMQVQGIKMDGEKAEKTLRCCSNRYCSRPKELHEPKDKQARQRYVGA